MTKVIFLNGPPRSGKDTAGSLLKTMVPRSETIKFAGSLKLATHALIHSLMGVDDRHGGPPDRYEDVKNCTAFHGKTWRELYIAVSEVLCKPTFGETFFGDIVARRIARDAWNRSTYIITDSGFIEECQTIYDVVGVENCRFVRLHRRGCTFAGDSRSYLDDRRAVSVDVYNDGSVDALGVALRPVAGWAIGPPV